LAGPRRRALLLLERGRLCIRTEARHSNAHHSTSVANNIAMPCIKAAITPARNSRNIETIFKT
jgi:hypothetical protein